MLLAVVTKANSFLNKGVYVSPVRKEEVLNDQEVNMLLSSCQKHTEIF